SRGRNGARPSRSCGRRIGDGLGKFRFAFPSRTDSCHRPFPNQSRRMSTTPLGPSDGEHHTLEHVDMYLQIGQELDASDVHLGVNAMPIWRRYGTLEPIWLKADKLSANDTHKLAYGFLN